jgi:hypothetical protein
LDIKGHGDVNTGSIGTASTITALLPVDGVAPIDGRMGESRAVSSNGCALRMELLKSGKIVRTKGILMLLWLLRVRG